MRQSILPVWDNSGPEGLIRDHRKLRPYLDGKAGLGQRCPVERPISSGLAIMAMRSQNAFSPPTMKGMWRAFARAFAKRPGKPP